MMAVSLSSLEYLWIESVPLCQAVSKDLGLEDNVVAETEYRMEKHGFNVGRGLAHVVTRDQERYLNSQLDIVKFVCKDLWTLLYSKSVDSLKTNHIDTYVLTDSNFLFCQRMSTKSGPEETLKQAAPYLWFPAGIIRGFLQGLGVKARVSFDATDLPLIDFSIVV